MGRAPAHRRADDAPALGDLPAVAHRAVADVGSPPLDREVGRGEAARLAADEREDLAPLRVDHRNGPRGACGQGVQRRDTGDGDAQGDGEGPRGDEAHAQPRVAAGPGADDDPVDVARVEAGLLQELLGVLQHPHGSGSSLAEHLAVADERDRRHVGGRVKREDQHLRIGLFPGLFRRIREQSVYAPPWCRNRTLTRAGGRKPSPASGHSTKTTASSK